MNIKHIVITGGGPSILPSISAIQYLNENGIIDFNKIESIYGTSAGAMIGALMCMRFDWETINDYVLKRPWNEVFNIKAQNIFEAYQKKGLFDRTIIEKIFHPLFLAKDIHFDITLKAFYEYSKIELHIFAFEVNGFITEDISYLTHPNMLLLDAVFMSSSIPFFMVPTIIENKCYVDGGVCANYPLNYCIDSGKNIDEILGIRNNYCDYQKNMVDVNSTLLDFMFCMCYNIFNHYMNTPSQKIKYEVLCNVNMLSLEYVNSFLNSFELRKEYHEKGCQSAKDFMQKHNFTVSQLKQVKV
jgi:predicted acylesterase/phospholipase RssA